MVLFFIEIFRSCIYRYNINTLKLFKDFAHAKKIKVLDKVGKNCIVVYEQDELKVDVVKNLDSEFLYLREDVIEFSTRCIFIKIINRDLINIIILQVIKFIVLMLLALVNIKLFFVFCVLTMLIKNNKDVNTVILLILCFMKLILYDRYEVIMAIILLLIPYKYVAISSVIPFVFIFNTNLYKIDYIFIYYLCNYILYTNVEKLNVEILNLNLQKNIVIKNVKNVVCGKHFTDKNGYYFWQIAGNEEIYINGINTRFIEMASITDKIKIINIRNHNSFFTNRVKYSKIDNSDSIIIFIYKLID